MARLRTAVVVAAGDESDFCIGRRRAAAAGAATTLGYGLSQQMPGGVLPRSIGHACMAEDTAEPMARAFFQAGEKVKRQPDETACQDEQQDEGLPEGSVLSHRVISLSYQRAVSIVAGVAAGRETSDASQPPHRQTVSQKGCRIGQHKHICE